jgi:hypothetical protein
MARRIDLPTLGGLACAGLVLALLLHASIRVEADDAASTTSSGSSARVAPPSSVAAGPLSTDWLGAGTPVLPTPVEGPACRPKEASTQQTAATLAEVRERLAAEMAAAENDGEFVVLNNRGYNYGPAEVTDPSLLEFEARRLAH